MPYMVCPNCGQKALKVATRCPRCGLAFEEQFFQHTTPAQRPTRIALGLLIAGAAVVTVLVSNALLTRLNIAPAGSPPVTPPAVASAPPAQRQPHPQPPREPLGAAAESVGTAPSPPTPPPRSPSESLPPGPESVRLAAPSTTPSATPSATAEPVSTIAAQRRYASTWMNVRATRSKTAAVLRILRPGEAVQVDLLEQGWYRVLSDQQPAGYVDRRLLDASPPPVSP